MNKLWQFLIIEAMLICQGIFMLLNPKWWQIILLPVGFAIGYFIKSEVESED